MAVKSKVLDGHKDMSKRPGKFRVRIGLHPSDRKALTKLRAAWLQRSEWSAVSAALQKEHARISNGPPVGRYFDAANKLRDGISVPDREYLHVWMTAADWQRMNDIAAAWKFDDHASAVRLAIRISAVLDGVCDKSEFPQA